MGCLILVPFEIAGGYQSETLDSGDPFMKGLVFKYTPVISNAQDSMKDTKTHYLLYQSEGLKDKIPNALP